MAEPIRVMIIDDSAVVRQVLGALLTQAPGISLLATASDPVFALEKMHKAWPDVIVLDIEMPRMDGLTFLRKVMSERPTPVVICSSLTGPGSQTALQAMAAGAFAVVTKPTLGLKNFLSEAAEELVSTVRAAGRANMRALAATPACANPVPRTAPASLAPAARLTPVLNETTDRLIAIGTSTGGTQALEAVLSRLPPTIPGMVVVQHMPEKFTALFAQRLNQVCALEVLEARDGQRIIGGRVLIAPGGKQMSVRSNGAYYVVDVRDGPPVNRHRPSVDVLFRSVARVAGRNAAGVIMTGMGDDGARGLKEMRDAGASTMAQDEASCVVFGMPREAIKLGAADRVLPLGAIADAIVAWGSRPLGAG